jgi:hypothetical protein
MNNKKRTVVEQEGLDNDEEEVEDLHDTWQIEDILCATYERKNRGHKFNTEEGPPFQIQINVEPTTPCATNTTKEEKIINQQVISGRRIFSGCGSSSRCASPTSSILVSTQCGGGISTNFTMTGQDPTIKLREF